MTAKLFILPSPRSTDHLWGSISHTFIPVPIFNVSSISDSVLTPSDLLIGLNLR